MAGVRMREDSQTARGVRWCFALALVASMFAVNASAPPSASAATGYFYRLVDLGAISGYTYGEGRAVNGGGTAIGTYLRSGSYQPFRYFRGVKTLLAAPASFPYAEVISINGSRQVAGWACSEEDACHVVRWSAAGTPEDLGALGGSDAYSQAINDAGVIVGTAGTAGPLTHAFVSSGSSLVDLNAFVTGSGWTLMQGRGINRGGDIIGGGWLDGAGHGYLLKSPYSTSNLVDLANFSPQSINTARHMAGVTATGSGSSIFDGTSFTPIPAFAGAASMYATSINDRDEVVGYGQRSGGDSRAFIYRNGVSHDLNADLVATDWTVEYASSINNSGEIAAIASRNGITHPVLLVPTWSVPSSFAPVSPKRMLDTRTNVGLAGKFHGGVPRRIKLNLSPVPPEAMAITANLTVTNQTATGFLAAGPSVLSSNSSVLNFVPGENVANGITVSLAGDGTLEIVYSAASTATADIILDVTGYFAPDDGDYDYATMTPTRMYDSRAGTPHPVLIGSPRYIQLTGNPAFSLPSNAVAVTGNLTITAPTAGGWVALSNTATPGTSTINFKAGQTRANNVTTRVTAGGGVWAVYGGAATGNHVDVVFDMTGYFVNASGLLFVPILPTRIVDTRTSLGLSSKLVCSNVRTVTVPKTIVPATARAIVGNATIVKPTSQGYLVLGPTVTLPLKTSTLNYVAGDVRANGATFRVGVSGTSATFQAAIGGCPAGASSDFVFDAMGYYK